ncbi:nitrate reductase molybdenum cofactor assembly chaperone [Thermoproteus uzoniensis]|uniref:nitrate reductase molybdenum cofactor assembly chaperone n=1 Tax=Thermoproteus uzoniensis TaxID=184117 RepID=UPI001F258BD3|nr:molecular chaperone TorD family protein [Thermoproteus uzoniensis]
MYGDSRKRGPALAKLLSIYSSRGFKPPPDELPDYLPTMLRFVAERGPHPAVARLAAKAAERIAKALRSEGNPYAPLMEAVAELLRQ